MGVFRRICNFIFSQINYQAILHAKGKVWTLTFKLKKTLLVYSLKMLGCLRKYVLLNVFKLLKKF